MVFEPEYLDDSHTLPMIHAKCFSYDCDYYFMELKESIKTKRRVLLPTIPQLSNNNINQIETLFFYKQIVYISFEICFVLFRLCVISSKHT